MKTYSSLSIDVIRFEAQDVITTSNAVVSAPSCICEATNCFYGVHEECCDMSHDEFGCPATSHNPNFPHHNP